MEFHWALIAAFGVMVLGTLNGLLVAVLVTVVSLIVRANNHSILADSFHTGQRRRRKGLLEL